MADNLPISLEQVFKTIVDQMPYGFSYNKLIVDEKNKPIDYITLEINKKFEEFTGLKREQVINQKITVAIPGIEKTTPDVISIYGKTALTGEASEIEFYFEPFKRWYRVYVSSPQKEYFIAIFSDISELKKSEVQKIGIARALQAISECNQVIIHGTSENEILQKVCEKMISPAGYKMAWVGYAQNDAEKSVIPVAQAGFEEGYLKNVKISWADSEYGRGPTGKAIRNKQIAVMQDIASNSEFYVWREEAMKRGYASSICLPLLMDDSTGALCIYSGEPNAFDEAEVKLLKEMGDDLAYGINSIRSRIEKEKAERELLQSRDQLQKVLKSISDGFFILDKDFRYTYINDQGAIMVGKESAKELLGKVLFDEFPQAKGGPYDKLYHDAMETKKIMHFEEFYKPFNKWFAGTIYPNPDGISIFFQDVTERKLREEELKKNETELKEAQRIGKVGSWEWDSTTDKITWSEEYYNIVGLDPKTPPPNYENHLKEYTPESAKLLDEAVKKTMQTGEPYELELEQLRPNGTRGWIIARAEVKRDEKNNIVGLRGTALDITNQKLSEEEVKKVSAYNRNLIEISPDPLVTISSDGKITDVNSATEKITGIERKELIGTNFSNYFTEPQKAEEGYQQVFKQGIVRDYPLQIKRKDGNTTPVLYNASVYKDEKGNIEGVFAAARDISQLEKIKTALSQTEERYKAYVENSNDVMYALDPNGLILYLSPQCRRFGLDPDALINKKTLKEIFPPEQGTELTKEFEKILISQHQGFVTFAYKDADERLFWLEASGTVQRDSKGNPIGAIGIIRDVTERKLAEDRLKELDTIKSRFIRVVSHQLRTPLAAIRWQLESLLSEHDHLSDLQKQLIKESHRADLEIISTINDLITALDIEEGREVRLDKSETSFISLWESVEIEYQEKCKVKNIACSLTKPPTIMPLIFIDMEKIRTALEKIADNALIYTKDEGQIFVTISQTETNIHFEIKDTGIGIPKDEQPYIFSRFYRASNAAIMKPDASGLGLYIAKNFIESHGGKIGFTSEEGKGSTFWFDIPIK